ncbi:methyltransferase domain-containing protein [Streptomyces sp. NBC_00006]|uniref:class I SAM-dependent methyltransferase n=1 Tax=Streptomyces sp. NBC_00006 TaxID=2975619 RepID=UPI0022550CAE|nr:class I SAM-dependent methyltransferase [Streptomyces sp. NBC_00006]MCX5529623.1 methyltransferase domain-containing protein [Streptomyces sp. NBC_00006]
MTYLSPLAYLLGVEGAALLRGIREGRADRAFVEARIAEIRTLLEVPALAQAEGVTASEGTISAADVYQEWAPHYDAPGNQMIDVEQPVVRRILDGLPVGTALDAACGTGRHTVYLHELGHDVIGVDASPEMLAQARNSLPDVDFHEAELHQLPLPDNAVDTVVCALALTHVPDLAAVLAEFARVLRPGGNLVISDAHLLVSYLRPTRARRPGPDGRPSLLTEYHRPLSAYLAAALPLGFQVRHCEEPRRPHHSLDSATAPDPLPTYMSWDLLHWCSDASAAALDDSPIVVIWHFQLDSNGKS